MDLPIPRGRPAEIETLQAEVGRPRLYESDGGGRPDAVAGGERTARAARTRSGSRRPRKGATGESETGRRQYGGGPRGGKGDAHCIPAYNPAGVGRLGNHHAGRLDGQMAGGLRKAHGKAVHLQQLRNVHPPPHQAQYRRTVHEFHPRGRPAGVLQRARQKGQSGFGRGTVAQDARQYAEYAPHGVRAGRAEPPPVRQHRGGGQNPQGGQKGNARPDPRRAGQADYGDPVRAGTRRLRHRVRHLHRTAAGRTVRTAPEERLP